MEPLLGAHAQLRKRTEPLCGASEDLQPFPAAYGRRRMLEQRRRREVVLQTAQLGEDHGFELDGASRVVLTQAQIAPRLALVVPVDLLSPLAGSALPSLLAADTHHGVPANAAARQFGKKEDRRLRRDARQAEPPQALLDEAVLLR